MDQAPGAKALIDFEQDVLGVRLQEQAPFAHGFGPTFHDWDHNIVDHERLRLSPQPLAHLDEQWGIVGALEVAAIQRKVRNQEPWLLRCRARRRLTDEKSPSAIAAA